MGNVHFLFRLGTETGPVAGRAMASHVAWLDALYLLSIRAGAVPLS